MLRDEVRQRLLDQDDGLAPFRSVFRASTVLSDDGVATNG